MVSEALNCKLKLVFFFFLSGIDCGKDCTSSPCLSVFQNTIDCKSLAMKDSDG